MCSSTRPILVVDDDASNRALLRRLLEHSGWAVAEAEDGLAALELAYRLRPCLILLDMKMPRLDGWQTTQCLHNDPNLTDIPVIAVTAYAYPTDRLRALRLGCTDYISKPFDVDMLVQRVQQHM